MDYGFEELLKVFGCQESMSIAFGYYIGQFIGVFNGIIIIIVMLRFYIALYTTSNTCLKALFTIIITAAHRICKAGLHAQTFRRR